MVRVFLEIVSCKAQSSAASCGKFISKVFLALAVVSGFSSHVAADQAADLKALVQGHYPLLSEQALASQSIREALALLERPFAEVDGMALLDLDVARLARLDAALLNSKLVQPQEANVAGQLVDLAVDELGQKVSRLDFSLKGALNRGSFHESLKYHLKKQFDLDFDKEINVNKPNSFQLVYGFYALILIFSAVFLKQTLFR